MVMTDETLGHMLPDVAWKGMDQTGTLARYRRILRVFAEWYETQYGRTFTIEAFEEEVMIRYQLHCSARLSKSSVRRIHAALRIFRGALVTTKHVDSTEASSNPHNS